VARAVDAFDGRSEKIIGWMSIPGCASVIRSNPPERVLGGPVAKFVFLYRKSADPNAQPSPAEMQAGYMQWKTWMGKYSKEILEQPPARSGPKPGGAAAVCRGGAVTDGPYVEGKEIVGGWSFIEAESIARAIEIAKEVPMFPSVEIIEIQTF
jgi:hypothetical protein